MSGRIVVGIDGSEGARRALDWAIEEARLRDASVYVVHTWHFPSLAGALDPDAIERAVEKTAKEMLERELSEVDTSGIEVERRLGSGNPADALLNAAHEGDLLVVGTRGHGGFTGLLIGSVSQQVSHHAPCPVVIVPPTQA